MDIFCMTFESKQAQYIECPFCSGLVEPKIGKMKCSECHARFEYYDRLECIFVDKSTFRLPIHGTVCGSCGLVRSEENKKCAYCGNDLSCAIQ